MNFEKINDLLTKGVIGTFLSVFLFSLLTLLIPIFSYLVGILVILLGIITGVNLIITTILFIKQINEMIDKLAEQYEREQFGE